MRRVRLEQVNRDCDSVFVILLAEDGYSLEREGAAAILLVAATEKLPGAGVPEFGQRSSQVKEPLFADGQNDDLRWRKGSENMATDFQLHLTSQRLQVISCRFIKATTFP